MSFFIFKYQTYNVWNIFVKERNNLSFVVWIFFLADKSGEIWVKMLNTLGYTPSKTYKRTPENNERKTRKKKFTAIFNVSYMFVKKNFESITFYTKIIKCPEWDLRWGKKEKKRKKINDLTVLLFILIENIFSSVIFSGLITISYSEIYAGLIEFLLCVIFYMKKLLNSRSCSDWIYMNK